MERLRSLLSEMRRRDALLRLLAAMLWAAAIGGGLVLAFSTADFFLCLQSHVRVVLLKAIEAALGASGVGLVVVLVLARKRMMRMAWEVERARPEFRNSLITAIEGGGSALGDAEVRGAVEKRACWLLERTDPDDVISIRPLLRAAQAAGGVLFAWMLAALLFGSAFTVSVRRALFPSSPIHPPTRTRIVEARPGHARAGLGQEIEFRCRAEGPAGAAGAARVLLSYDRKHWCELEMAKDANGVWRATLDCLRGNAAYYFQAGSTKTDLFTLTATRPPSVEDVQVSASGPDGERADFACAQCVRVGEGSEVSVQAKASEAVLVTAGGLEAWLEFDDGRRLRMEVGGGVLEGRFRAEADCRYRFVFRPVGGGEASASCWREVCVADAGPSGEEAGPGQVKKRAEAGAPGSGSGSGGGGGGPAVDDTSPFEERSQRVPGGPVGFGAGRPLRALERPATVGEDSLPGAEGIVSESPEGKLGPAAPLPPKELERLAKEARLRASPEYRELVAAYYRTLARSREDSR